LVLSELLVTILGFRNKHNCSKFYNLTSQGYFIYKFRLKKVKPWVLLRKFHCRTNLMHLICSTVKHMYFLLPICGKFIRDHSLYWMTQEPWSNKIFFFTKTCKKYFLSIKQQTLGDELQTTVYNFFSRSQCRRFVILNTLSLTISLDQKFCL
jgi:hypothetical protein